MSGKRGQRTKEQQAYIARCVEFGCLLTWIKTGISGTPAIWHHRRSGTGAGMIAAHEDGIALAPRYHDAQGGPEALHHLGRRAWEQLHGVTELELIERSKEMHGWATNAKGK